MIVDINLGSNRRVTVDLFDTTEEPNKQEKIFLNYPLCKSCTINCPWTEIDLNGCARCNCPRA